MYKNIGLGVLALVLATTSVAALAQPHVGDVLQKTQQDLNHQTRTEKPRQTPAQPAQPAQNEAQSNAASEVSFDVSLVKIEGVHSVSKEELERAAGIDTLNGRVTLHDLQSVAQKITNFYRRNNFLITRAYIPPQTVENGVITIAVVEGKIAHIFIDNESGINTFALSPLKRIKTGVPARTSDFRRGLRLAQDVPGIQISSTLKPGTKAGTTDLHVTVTKKPASSRISGATSINNYGSEATGRVRSQTALDVANLFNIGDREALNLIISQAGLRYLDGSASMPIDSRGTRAKIGGSYLKYELNGAFSELNAGGEALSVYAQAQHPFVLRQNYQLFGTVRVAHQRFEDKIGVFDIDDKKNVNSISARLNGNWFDGLGRGGVTSAMLGVTHGSVDMSAGLRKQVENTSQTNGEFSKLNMSIQRWQSLADDSSLVLRFAWQKALDNLVSAQGVLPAGVSGVRGFTSENVLSADSAAVGTIALRHDLSGFVNMPWSVTGSVFGDAAHMTINAAPWSDDTDITQTLASIGVGIHVAPKSAGWNASADIAVPVHNSTGSANGVAAWFSFSTNF